MNNLEYNIHYWGPLLFKAKVRTEDIKGARKICDAATEKFNTGLSAIIDDEVTIDGAKYNKILQPYLETFKKAFKIWYGSTINKIIISSSWVNYMKKGECNPPHVHDNCHLSSVLLLQVPETLKKEQKDWIGTGRGPGALIFSTGNPQSLHTSTFNFKPEVGDLFMFPWNLTHSVSSYKSNSRRISIAANFKIELDQQKVSNNYLKT